MSAGTGSDKQRMATVASQAVDFDYANRVFGDGEVIDAHARTWGAVRMRRCLESLEGVSGQVLEVGCGAGRCIRTIRHHRPDLSAFGCDLSERAIEQARRQRDGVEYDTADAMSLPYDDATFDAVVIMDLLEHVPDVLAVLAEVRRVSKPGARLHLHVPCEGSLLTLYRPLLAMGVDLTGPAVGHIHHFTRGQVLCHLSDAGFRLQRCQYSMYLFGQLHDLFGWWTLLRRGSNGEGAAPGPGDHAPAAERVSDTAQPFRLKHLVSRPAWWLIRTVLPKLQYLELRALSWQPMGAVGLCVTAARDEINRDSDQPAQT